MCVHTQAQADAKSAIKAARESEKAAIEAEITKIIALRNTYSNCIEKMKCVENELSDMSIVAGEKYDKGISEENISKMKLEENSWKNAETTAHKNVTALEEEIAILTSEIAQLMGSDCGPCAAEKAAAAEAAAAASRKRR